jgi:hypothetical protein
MADVLRRAEERQKRAVAIIEDLDLTNRWARFGRPVVVGSVSHGLVVALDIDMEVYSDSPRIAEGFQVMAEVAESENVVAITFKNDLDTRGQWLYWEVKYRDAGGETWVIETYHCAPGDPYAHWPEQLAEAMKSVLTDEQRIAILSIKEALCERGMMADMKSTDIYRAVMDCGLLSVDEFLEWLPDNKAAGITHWLPKSAEAAAGL